MAKQTAVEWYADEHLKLLLQLENKELTIGGYAVEHQNIRLKARQMEKEQIIKAYNQDLYGGLSGDKKFDDGEQYYNETYGKK